MAMPLIVGVQLINLVLLLGIIAALVWIFVMLIIVLRKLNKALDIWLLKNHADKDR